MWGFCERLYGMFYDTLSYLCWQPYYLTTRPGGRFVFRCEKTPGKIGLPWGLSDWRVTSSGSL